MKELRDQVEAYAQNPRATYVLATVVATHGSTYRKVGARLLMDEHGWLSGAISGGCVERDLLRKAFWRTAERGRALVTYHGASDDEEGGALARGFGLGCDGSIEVLLQRVEPDAAVHPLGCLARVVHTGAPAVLATVLPGGDQRWHFADGTVAGELEPALASRVDHESRRLLQSASEPPAAHAVVLCEPGAERRVVFELVVPPPRLVIFGQNYDALPLASFAEQLGWDVTLVAQREPPRAPRAVRSSARLVLGRLPEVLERVRLDARTFVVAMSHDLARDAEVLKSALAVPCRYVGALGPARRTERMLATLRSEGVSFPSQALARLHAPVGLDLGARSPEEIALSIMAELQATLRGAKARALGVQFAGPAGLRVSA